MDIHLKTFCTIVKTPPRFPLTIYQLLLSILQEIYGLAVKLTECVFTIKKQTHLNCYFRFAAAHTLDNEKANTDPILSLFPKVILQERDHGFHLAFRLPHS